MKAIAKLSFYATYHTSEELSDKLVLIFNEGDTLEVIRQGENWLAGEDYVVVFNPKNNESITVSPACIDFLYE